MFYSRMYFFSILSMCFVWKTPLIVKPPFPVIDPLVPVSDVMKADTWSVDLFILYKDI